MAIFQAEGGMFGTSLPIRMKNTDAILGVSAPLLCCHEIPTHGCRMLKVNPKPLDKRFPSYSVALGRFVPSASLSSPTASLPAFAFASALAPAPASADPSAIPDVRLSRRMPR